MIEGENAGTVTFAPDQLLFCIQFIYLEDNNEESGCRAARETKQKINSELNDVGDDGNCRTQKMSGSRFKVQLFQLEGEVGEKKINCFILIANVN